MKTSPVVEGSGTVSVTVKVPPTTGPLDGEGKVGAPNRTPWLLELNSLIANVPVKTLPGGFGLKVCQVNANGKPLQLPPDVSTVKTSGAVFCGQKGLFPLVWLVGLFTDGVKSRFSVFQLTRNELKEPAMLS